MQDYLTLMQNRSSVRSYTDQPIAKKDLDYILECARLSPSSLGLEPWIFWVFQDQKRKNELGTISFNQNHVKNCAAIIAIISRADFAEYFEEKLRKRGLNEAELKMRVKTYKPFLQNMNNEEAFSYAIHQSYIATANIINAAHHLGLASCIIGGFDKNKINEYLKLDTSKQRVSLLITLGYAKDSEVVKKSRFDFDEVVKFVD